MQSVFLINGRYDECLTPLDRGFAYGDGVFRTLPVHGGRPDCWELHFRKLSEDCKALGIVCPTSDVLLGDIALLCREDGDAAIKIVITRGESGRGYAVPALAQPCRVVIRSPLPDYPQPHFSDGVHLHLCKLRLAFQPRLAGVKHLNRLENVLARMEWVDAQVADGVLLDSDDRVIECTASNIFILEGRSLVTPDLSRCGVAGVTRQRILELAPHLGYSAKMESFGLERLLGADEVILCNSLYGAWQARSLDGTTLPAGTLAARMRDLLRNEHARPE